VKKESLELKIGIFVLVGIALLAALIIIFGEIEVLSKSYKITCDFRQSVGDISPGVAVKFRGLRIGNVSDVRLLPDGAVRLVLKIRENYNVKEDAKIVVVQTSILGESYIEITPGSEKAGFVPKDGSAKLPGEVKITLSDMPEIFVELLKKYEKKVSSIIDNLDSTVRNLNRVVGDMESQQYLKDTLRNASLTLEKGPEIAENIAQLMKSGNELAEKLKESAKTFDTRVAKIGDTYVTLGKDLNARLNDITDRLNKILASMQRIVDRTSPESTVAKLISEDQLYRKLIETLNEAKLTLAQIKRTARYFEENPSAVFWGPKKKKREERPFWEKIFPPAKEKGSGAKKASTSGG